MKNVSIDEPIIDARDFLIDWVSQHPNGRIVFLSGRTIELMEETKQWLHEHGFPNGDIILRRKIKTFWFKTNQLSKLKKEASWIVHIGDSEDDIKAAEASGVPCICIVENKWDSQHVLAELNRISRVYQK